MSKIVIRNHAMLIIILISTVCACNQNDYSNNSKIDIRMPLGLTAGISPDSSEIVLSQNPDFFEVYGKEYKDSLLSSISEKGRKIFQETVFPNDEIRAECDFNFGIIPVRKVTLEFYDNQLMTVSLRLYDPHDSTRFKNDSKYVRDFLLSTYKFNTVSALIDDNIVYGEELIDTILFNSESGNLELNYEISYHFGVDGSKFRLGISQNLGNTPNFLSKIIYKDKNLHKAKQKDLNDRLIEKEKESRKNL